MASDFLKKVTGGDVLRGVLGGRECSGSFFNPNGQSVDVSTVCHDVRSIDIKEGEQAYVSVRDLRRREGEAFAQLGMVCNLRALEMDTTLLLRVWVDETAAGPKSGQRRVVGEARVPLTRLISIYNACMYHTWITLDTPGLHDSVASLGFQDEGASFDQAIQEGPKQLAQPKACISVCRSADIGPTGKVLWTADAPPESRASWWAPLLRSQQQHVMLSAALFLKSERQAAQLESSSTAGYPSQPSQPSPELQDRLRSQVEEIDKLRSQLDAAHSQMQQQQLDFQRQQQAQQAQPSNSLFRTQPNLPPGPQRSGGQADDNGMGGLSITQGHRGPSPYDQEAQARRLAGMETRLADAEAREHRAIEDLRAAVDDADHAKAEHHRVQQELDKISSEANKKIEAANDRIRTLRSQREKAENDLQQVQSTTIPLLQEEKSTLEAESRQLQEQKEALLRIVEDLHQTCIAAGLNTAGRQSIDNMTCTITQEFRLT
jgi:hypothetical protein